MKLELVGIADLEDRWVYTRQGIHKISRSTDFPKPAAIINRGRVRMWHLFDIENFEKSHPEVTDDIAKKNKIIGYARAVTKDD